MNLRQSVGESMVDAGLRLSAGDFEAHIPENTRLSTRTIEAIGRVALNIGDKLVVYQPDNSSDPEQDNE